MHIYYEESIFRSNTKEELIGFTEFLCTVFQWQRGVIINSH